MAQKQRGRLTAPGPLKAGYIYSILPDSVKSFLLGQMTPAALGRLNRALERIDRLGVRERSTALRAFIAGMGRLRRERERAVDRSLGATFALIGFFISAAALYAFVSGKPADGAFAIIDYLVLNGGMHAILLPGIWTAVRFEYRTAPLRVLLSSSNHLVDVSLGIIAGLVIGAVFAQPGPPVHPVMPAAARALAGCLATTAGPAVEELFFRYVVFIKMGGKHGMAAGAAVSVLLFTAAHLPGTLALAAAYVFAGGVLCVLCAARKAVLPALVAHALSNALVFFT